MDDRMTEKKNISEQISEAITIRTADRMTYGALGYDGNELMEIFPIKHKEESCLRIEGADGGVIFNVIVPTSTPKYEETQN